MRHGGIEELVGLFDGEGAPWITTPYELVIVLIDFDFLITNILLDLSSSFWLQMREISVECVSVVCQQPLNLVLP
jgi:hypothetical protein